MSSLGLFLSMAALVVSLAIHGLTYWPHMVPNRTVERLGHAVVIASSLMAVVSLVRPNRDRKRRGGERPFAYQRRNERRKTRFEERVFARIPLSMRVLVVLAFVYALINFMVCGSGMDWGSPSQKDGRYSLVSHGETLREITADEYEFMRLLQSRRSSGHLILLSLFSVIVFACAVRPVRRFIKDPARITAVKER